MVPTEGFVPICHGLTPGIGGGGSGRDGGGGGGGGSGIEGSIVGVAIECRDNVGDTFALGFWF
jgi:hypothetical protein